MSNTSRNGLDPSVYRHETTPARKTVMSQRPRHELAGLLRTDWDVGVATILATLGTVPQAGLHRFLTSVPSVARGTGCDGWLAQLELRYGVEFDPAMLFRLESEEALYKKMLQRRNDAGIFRTLQLVGGVESQDDEVRGLHAVWCLSSLGASALSAKSSCDKPTKPAEISFPTANTGYSLPTLIHDAQTSTFLLSLLVGFAENAQHSSGIWDVVDIYGNGERWGTGGSSMFPDSVVKVICNGEPVTIIVENDSGTMNDDRLQKKATAYLRYLMVENAYSWARPWLLFVCPENKLRTHERAILAAYDDTGLLATGGGGRVGRIAVVTHEDIGRLGATTQIYHIFSPREKSLLPLRYGLEAMAWGSLGGSSALCS